MEPGKETLFRRIPSVDILLQSDEMQRWATTVPRLILVDAVRGAVEDTRGFIARGACGVADEAAIRNFILTRADERLRRAAGPYFRRAINATGIILHTGLGRAALPARALAQINEQLAGYSVLQVDTDTGKRSRRDERIEWLLRHLTGCEAATVVNNNAAATMLVLGAVAAGKEVIVSRGQLVEIGGSFRLPDVMAASGAKMVEVGTTNKTHARDYEKAITENTAAILRVHPSNYKIVGFTAEVPLAELAEIAHSRNLTLIDDVGAGALLDFSRFGFTDQTTLPDSVRGGADLITCSADKLIGGPQGGIILGKAALIEKVRKNPLARIVRVGKMTLAALEATLSLFLDEATALSEVPTLAMLSRDLAQVREAADRIAQQITELARGATIMTLDGQSEMGSGSLPAQPIPTRLVSVTSDHMTPDELAARLRRREPPVFARIQEDRVLIDPRTLLDGEEEIVIEAVLATLNG
jgi:L-seryl-tRNA(Ser) seleniumtransferase